MTSFTYPAMVAWDPNASLPVRNTIFQVYATTDTTFTTPLAITDPFGKSLPNLNSGSLGVIPQFEAPNGTVVISDSAHTYAWTVGAEAPDPVSKWTPSTSYSAGRPVVNPAGELVTALADHTSGNSYTPGNWQAVNRVFNVKSFGAAGNGTTDDYATIDAAAQAASAAGGGTVYLPPGAYKISAALKAYSYVTYQGAGIGVTIIRPYQSQAFAGSATISAPFIRPGWRDMTWDGQDIPAANSLKGQFHEYLQGATWERVECKNFTATGFGSDYLQSARYLHCIATNNGRGQAIDGPGMSGFGVGTGAWQVEDILIQGCIATGNTNYGIFFERQPNTGAYNSQGVRVIGNYLSGNGYGIGGCGVDGAIYTNNIATGSVRDGIIIGAGSGSSPLGMPDKRATISNNQVYSNGRDGIRLDYGPNSIPANQARHLITSNNVYGNTGNGILLLSSKWASDVVRGIKIIANKITGNGLDGIQAAQTSGAEAGAYIADLHVEDNDINANNPSGGSGGIHFNVPLTRPVVKNNTVFDDQATQTQGYGIVTDATFTLTDATIRDNSLLSNKTGGAAFNAPFAGDSSVRGNRGYFPGWASITVPASPFTYTCGVTPEVVYWAGGSTSNVAITPKGSTQATVLLSAGAETIPLHPGDVVQFTYTSAPTSLKTVKQQ